ncbi:hypothetical protein GGX14DRAFT_404163 [Mycena pura]|uniref:Uncharacterized protein n=1 Tax=Mycena pura TaxID=153505 RepID=A0AAD6UYI5_9AGAR|nr:hypothetical protein GGX14DRAFT_404163 [Mycena pura]
MTGGMAGKRRGTNQFFLRAGAGGGKAGPPSQAMLGLLEVLSRRGASRTSWMFSHWHKRNDRSMGSVRGHPDARLPGCNVTELRPTDGDRAAFPNKYDICGLKAAAARRRAQASGGQHIGQRLCNEFGLPCVAVALRRLDRVAASAEVHRAAAAASFTSADELMHGQLRISPLRWVGVEWDTRVFGYVGSLVHQEKPPMVIPLDWAELQGNSVEYVWFPPLGS